MVRTSREVRLIRRPRGLPTLDDFQIAEVDLPKPREGAVQVRNMWLSVDPYMRARMDERELYFPPFALGAALEGGAIGEVVMSNHSDFVSGDIVLSNYGWREAFNTPGAQLHKLDLLGVPPQAFLGAAGMPGFTAHVGLFTIGALQPEDVVFVSGAAGAVGQMVCQLARRNGNRVIGSAGGPDKVALLKTIGVDAVIDYKNCADLSAAVAQAAPDGIDVYFDNVGGEHLDAALHSANTCARFVLCGMISHYNAENARHPVYEMSDAVFKQIALKGFIITSYMDGFGDFIEAVAPDIAAGRIVSTETVRSGIHNAVPAFLDLFSGNNTGKMLVDLT